MVFVIIFFICLFKFICKIYICKNIFCVSELIHVDLYVKTLEHWFVFCKVVFEQVNIFNYGSYSLHYSNTNIFKWSQSLNWNGILFCYYVGEDAEIYINCRPWANKFAYHLYNEFCLKTYTIWMIHCFIYFLKDSIRNIYQWSPRQRANHFTHLFKQVNICEMCFWNAFKIYDWYNMSVRYKKKKYYSKVTKCEFTIVIYDTSFMLFLVVRF